MLEADRARRTMTAGAVGGRKGGTASANKRLRKALKDSPRVKVVASAPANAKEHRGAARHQPAPLLLDAKALDVLTTQVVMGVLGSLTLTNKQRSLCTVAAAAAATAVGHAIGQLARKVAGRAQSDPKTEKTVLKGAERIASDNDTGPAAKRAKTRSASTSSGHTTQHTCTATQCLSGAAAPKKRKRLAAAASAAAVETALHAAASDAPPPPDAAALGGSKRGALLVVQPTAAYAARSDYSFEDVVALARKLDAGELQPADLDLRDESGKLIHGIPRKTMNTWRQDDHKRRVAMGHARGVEGEPHWKIEFEVRGRTELSKSGPGTVLGAAETALMLEVANMAAKNMPYEEEELADMLRDTAIQLGSVDPKTKKPYHKDSNVTQLAIGFKERCLEKGVTFVLKGGRGLSKQRYWNATPDVLNHYRDEVSGPALTSFQDENGALTLEDVGNWDESGIDLCDFASNGNYWCLRAFGCSVLTPYERSPHFTLIMGYKGRKRLVAMLIRTGDEYIAPHPAHAQCLAKEWVVVIAQSPKGWVDTRLKTAFLQLQLDCPDLDVGERPCWFNVDGHDTNTRNADLRDKCEANKIGLIAPPSHTSAASHGRTQQMDLPASMGGTIAAVKACWRRLMRKQHRAAMLRDDRKGVVSVAEIAAMLEQALESTWQPEKAVAMNEEVGYRSEPLLSPVLSSLSCVCACVCLSVCV